MLAVLSPAWVAAWATVPHVHNELKKYDGKTNYLQFLSKVLDDIHDVHEVHLVVKAITRTLLGAQCTTEAELAIWVAYEAGRMGYPLTNEGCMSPACTTSLKFSRSAAVSNACLNLLDEMLDETCVDLVQKFLASAKTRHRACKSHRGAVGELERKLRSVRLQSAEACEAADAAAQALIAEEEAKQAQAVRSAALMAAKKLEHQRLLEAEQERQQAVERERKAELERRQTIEQERKAELERQHAADRARRAELERRALKHQQEQAAKKAALARRAQEVARLKEAEQQKRVASQKRKRLVQATHPQAHVCVGVLAAIGFEMTAADLNVYK